MTAFRAALEVYTREQLPQDWARTQNNLGNALLVQGKEASGEEGPRLLGEAVTAYRGCFGGPKPRAVAAAVGSNAEQPGQRAFGPRPSERAETEGPRLLGEAVTAFRAALEVRSREQLPQEWATSQNNLGPACTRPKASARSEEGEPAAAGRSSHGLSCRAGGLHSRAVAAAYWAVAQSTPRQCAFDQGKRANGEDGTAVAG